MPRCLINAPALLNWSWTETAASQSSIVVYSVFFCEMPFSISNRPLPPTLATDERRQSSIVVWLELEVGGALGLRSSSYGSGWIIEASTLRDVLWSNTSVSGLAKSHTALDVSSSFFGPLLFRSALHVCHKRRMNSPFTLRN